MSSHHLFRSRAARAITLPMSWLYGAALSLRPVSVTHTAAVPVISVGNIHAGGTGKTPLVISLANFLKGRNWSPAVVSRGYRGRLSPRGAEVTRMSSADEAGDEPIEILERCPGVRVFIGADRVRAAKAAAEHADVIILDDGFQHRRLARNIDIVVIPVGADPAAETLLPHGRLREPYAALEKAGAVVMVGGGEGVERREPESLLRAYTSAPFFHARRIVESIRPFPGAPESAALFGRRVVVFCGIGDSASFVRTVEACGAEVAETFAFRDHHRMNERDLARIGNAVSRHGAIAVTTGKDAARLGGRRLPFPAAVISMRMECSELCEWVVGTLGNPGPRKSAPAG